MPTGSAADLITAQRLFSICLVLEVGCLFLLVASGVITRDDVAFEALVADVASAAAGYGYHLTNYNGYILAIGFGAMIAWIVSLAGLWLRKPWAIFLFGAYTAAGFIIPAVDPFSIRVVPGWEDALSGVGMVSAGIILALGLTQRRQLGFLSRSERRKDLADRFG